MRTRSATLGLMAVLVLGNVGAVGVQGAQAQTTQAAASASVSFTRDLTLGSMGADVTALQNWLISKGFGISAGATGYFGSQTRAALAAYQAANGIVPAAGYFGPITRARVNAGGVVTPTPNPTPDTGSQTLRGGEADLTDYDLRREEPAGSEGEEEVEIATATFDVDNGDVRVERVELTVTGTNTALNTQPWRYFDRIAILADGREIADMDVDSRSDWSKSGNGYRLSFTGIKHVVREGDTAELTIVADISSSIDSDDLAQTFTIAIADRGIRAVDSEGIQQYIGEDSESITFGFDEEENGDLRITRGSDNPESAILVADDSRESDEYEVFEFDLTNRDDVDSLISELAVTVTNLNSGVNASTVIRRATLEVGRESYQGDIENSRIVFEDMDLEIGGDDEETATLVVRLARFSTSTPIGFSVAGSDVEAEGVRSGNDASVSGTASSELHQIALSGIAVDGVSTAQASFVPGDDASAAYATYTLKFTVTGLDEDAYIASTTASSTSAGAGNAGVIYEIGGNAFTGSESAVLTSTARMEDGFYLVREGRTETFTLTVSLNPEVAGFYDVRLNTLRFNEDADLAGSMTFTLPNASEYRTNPVYISN